MKPYRDSLGVLTVGWGTNIEQISQEEADWLFEHRFEIAQREAAQFDFYDNLNEPRKAVIDNMMYNLGLDRFRGFVNTIQYLRDGDYEMAAVEMLRSKWATQVGDRADRLSIMMRTGEWL